MISPSILAIAQQGGGASGAGRILETDHYPRISRDAQLDSSTHGAVLKTKHGNFIQNPLVGVVNTLRRDMQRWASEFGLSPSARTQIEAVPPSADDAIARKYFS